MKNMNEFAGWTHFPLPAWTCAYCGQAGLDTNFPDTEATPWVCAKNPRNRAGTDPRMIDVDEMVLNPGRLTSPNDRTVSLAKRLLAAWPEASAELYAGGQIALSEVDVDDSIGRTWVHLVIVGCEEDVAAREDRPTAK